MVTGLKDILRMISNQELEKLEYFVNNGKKAAVISEPEKPLAYITRTTATNSKAYTVDYDGNYKAISQGELCYFRPAFVLPADTRVENTEYNGQAALKFPEENKGIYVFEDGAWKECI